MGSEINLVLSGSGARLPVFVGALQAFRDAGIKVNQVVGSSGGSIVGALHCCGVSLSEMEDIIVGTDYSQFVSLGWSKLLAFPFRGYLNSSFLFKEFLRMYLGDKMFIDAPNLSVLVTDLCNGETDICNAKTTPALRVVDAVYASAAIPLVFQYEKLPDTIWVDAGLRYNFALDFFKDDKRPTFGVKLRSDYCKAKNPSVSEVLSATISNMIDASDRKHIEDATYSMFVEVNTKHVSTLDFAASKDTKRWLEKQGYDTVLEGLKARGLA